MTETSRPWGGQATGDAGPYTFDNWVDMIQSLVAALGAGEGVFKTQLNGLVVSGAASPLSVATGNALVNGTWYHSDAAESVVIATPGASTRIDRVILRKGWAAQTVRIALLAGVEGSGVPPVLTQTDGVTWEVSLAQASITTGGVVTITDERQFIIDPGILRYTAHAAMLASRVARS